MIAAQQKTSVREFAAKQAEEERRSAFPLRTAGVNRSSAQKFRCMMITEFSQNPAERFSSLDKFLCCTLNRALTKIRALH
jgi:hypothetical protein